MRRSPVRWKKPHVVSWGDPSDLDDHHSVLISPCGGGSFVEDIPRVFGAVAPFRD